MQTADDWATQSASCSVPGPTPGVFPATTGLSTVCKQSMYSTDLVDKNSLLPYARMYVYRDSNDMLYITVSLNATDTGGGQVRVGEGGGTGKGLGRVYKDVTGCNHGCSVWCRQTARYRVRSLPYTSALRGPSAKHVAACCSVRYRPRCVGLPRGG